MAFFETYAIRVEQPLGEFFLTSIPSDVLLQISFVEEMQYIDVDGTQKGNQRKRDKARLADIARYIQTVEMAFPNSIILAANYTQSGVILEQPEEDENTENEFVRWYIEGTSIDNVYKIVVPTSQKLASIVDGQHRVWAFEELQKELNHKSVDLPCAIFFDLPNSYQAFLFATINGNQKKVDRSLSLELFGFNVEDESPKSWTPEKLAVFLSRKFNNKIGPFHKRIKIAPLDPKKLFVNKKDWFISTATLVDGILALISGNPKRDRVVMARESILTGRSRGMVSSIRDNSPLRDWYLDGQDDQIYNTVRGYFLAVEELLWDKSVPNSYIRKTVGVLALFDLLKRLLSDLPIKRKVYFVNNSFLKDDPLLDSELKTTFAKYIEPFQHVDFTDNFFQASGVGRARIRTILLIANGYEVRASESVKNELKRLLTNYPPHNSEQ